MSEAKDDGGPAFPGFGYEIGSGNCKTIFGPDGQVLNHIYFPGATLRDLFAGMALIGLNANKICDIWPEETLAEAAYKQADAMIKARGKS